MRARGDGLKVEGADPCVVRLSRFICGEEKQCRLYVTSKVWTRLPAVSHLLLLAMSQRHNT